MLQQVVKENEDLKMERGLMKQTPAVDVDAGKQEVTSTLTAVYAKSKYRMISQIQPFL